MSHTILKFRCDTCEREYSTLKGAEKHEKICYYNPSRKACITCIHLVAYQNDDVNYQEFGEVISMPGGHSVQCELGLDIEDTGMCNGSIDHVMKSNCSGWELRNNQGTYQFGKVMLLEPE